MNNQNEENRLTKSKDIVIKYVNLLILLFISDSFLLVFYRSFRVFSVYIYLLPVYFFPLLTFHFILPPLWCRRPKKQKIK